MTFDSLVGQCRFKIIYLSNFGIFFIQNQGPSETEKVRLYEQLEKAESRVITLERTLADNSRLWARERQDLQTRLREAEHGFARTQNMVLHDYPSDPYRPSHSYDPSQNTRRFGPPKLDPIRRV